MCMHACVWVSLCTSLALCILNSPSRSVPCKATGRFPFSLSLHAESSCCFSLFMALHLSFNSALCLFLHISPCQCFPSLRLRNLLHLLFAPLHNSEKSLYCFTHSLFFHFVPILSDSINLGFFLILVLSSREGKFNRNLLSWLVRMAQFIQAEMLI